MGCVERVRSLLERAAVPFQVIEHPEAREAEDVAKTSHVRGRRLARVVVARDAHEHPVMLVLPASEHLDLDTACRVVGTSRLTVATAADLRRTFPDCEPGAIPPFPAIYGVPAVLDLCFFEEEEDNGEIYFEAGNHRELVAMRFADFRRIAGPFTHEACLHPRPSLARSVKHGGRGALS